AEDILVLAEHYAINMVKEMGQEFFAGFSENVQRQLLSYSWPGNIRELKNVVERAVYQHPEREINRLVFNPFESPYRPSVSPVRAGDVGDSVQSAESAPDPVDAPQVSPALNASGLDFREYVQNYETELLRKALEHCQFNQRKTASFLNLSYHQLRGYLRKYDLLS
ncbi:MAG: phage shock protein operon transcriptional activator, partial [Gammaproteobacteria bacterium]|nr:phage shock protein operon transcriptional activator [Gammaproteobacteria bacterium]